LLHGGQTTTPLALLASTKHLEGIAHGDLGELRAPQIVDLVLVHLPLLVAAVDS